VCGETCRPVDLGGMRWTSAATVVGGKVVAVTANEHVLAVWTEGGTARYFATTSKLVPRLVTASSTTLDVIGTTDDDAVVIVRVPLR